jgi:hypothetical protein
MVRREASVTTGFISDWRDLNRQLFADTAEGRGDAGSPG